jgi:hypothetical protein
MGRSRVSGTHPATIAARSRSRRSVRSRKPIASCHPPPGVVQSLPNTVGAKWRCGEMGERARRAGYRWESRLACCPGGTLTPNPSPCAQGEGLPVALWRGTRRTMVVVVARFDRDIGSLRIGQQYRLRGFRKGIAGGLEPPAAGSPGSGCPRCLALRLFAPGVNDHFPHQLVTTLRPPSSVVLTKE